jgi:hypothetical protein
LALAAVGWFVGTGKPLFYSGGFESMDRQSMGNVFRRPESEEVLLMAAVCMNPEFYPKLRNALGLGDLRDPRALELFITMEEWYRDGGTGKDDLLSRIKDNDLRDFVAARGSSPALPPNVGQVVSDGITRICLYREEIKRRSAIDRRF